MLTFSAPEPIRADSHQRDAKLWAWAESQQIATIENIEIINGEVRVTTMLDLDLRTTVRLLTSFADAFGWGPLR